MSFTIRIPELIASEEKLGLSGVLAYGLVFVLAKFVTTCFRQLSLWWWKLRQTGFACLAGVSLSVKLWRRLVMLCYEALQINEGRRLIFLMEITGDASSLSSRKTTVLERNSQQHFFIVIHQRFPTVFIHSPANLAT